MSTTPDFFILRPYTDYYPVPVQTIAEKDGYYIFQNLDEDCEKEVLKIDKKSDHIYKTYDEAYENSKEFELKNKINQLNTKIESKELRAHELVEIITSLEKKGKEIQENNKKITGWAVPKFKPNDKLYFFNPKYVEDRAYELDYNIEIDPERYLHNYWFHTELIEVILTENLVKYRFKNSEYQQELGQSEYSEIEEKYCFTELKAEGNTTLLEFVKECKIQKEAKKEEEITTISKEIDRLQLKLEKLSNQSK